MASIVVIPTIYWSGYSDVDTAAVIGSEYTTTKIYAAMNSVRLDAYPIWSQSDQPITIDHGASFTPSALFTNVASAFYIKAMSAIANTLNGGYNYWKFYTGSSAAGTLRTPQNVFGDGVINSDKIEYSSPTTDNFVHTIGVFGDDYTDRYHRLTLGNDAVGSNSTFWIYEFMIGHSVSLPDGWLREERDVSWGFPYGNIKPSFSGNQIWNGQWASGNRRAFEYNAIGCDQATRDRWVSIFKYSRGVLPVVIMEDSAGLPNTISKFFLTDYSETESAQGYDIVIGVEEV